MGASTSGFAVGGGGLAGAGAALVEAVCREISNEALAHIDYVKLCDSETLADIDVVDDQALLALAVNIGKTRLIDNRVLQR